MKTRQSGTAVGQAVPPPTATVDVSETDELDVWVVGEGVPVVLVHGALVWSLLAPLAEELAQHGYRAIWYARRGYRGKPIAPPVSVENQALDVVRILDALGIGKAHVVGHSAGSMYALELATLAQDRLSSVTLLDFVLVGQVASREMFMEAMKPSVTKAQAGDFQGAAAQMFETLGATEELLERVLPGSWAAMAQDAPTWFGVEVPASMQWVPDPARIEMIGVPVAFLTVSELPPFRETGELLQTWLPHLTVLDIATDHHFFPITATAETAAMIDRWIASQAPNPSGGA